MVPKKTEIEGVFMRQALVTKFASLAYARFAIGAAPVDYYTGRSHHHPRSMSSLGFRVTVTLNPKPWA